MAPSKDADREKQLARKLFWAVSSTFPGMTKRQKASTFTWAAEMAERVIARVHPSHPPPVDTSTSNGYHGQADGRGGGRYDPSLPRAPRPLPPPTMASWDRQQKVMRDRAWAYVLTGRRNGDQLPVPADVYREVGNGRSNSTGEDRGDGAGP